MSYTSLRRTRRHSSADILAKYVTTGRSTHMSYAVMHMQKLKAGAMRGIENHNERLRKSHTNPDIEYEKSFLNEDLTPDDSRTYYRRVKERIDELHLAKTVRKDAVVCTGFICTSDSEYFQNLSETETDRFFIASLAFLQNRYGKENVIAATVHHDEKTPHLHAYIVPVTKDGRLSAKEIFTPRELRGLQTDYHATMNAAGFKLERGQAAEDTGRKHLSTQELKRETGGLQKTLEAAKAAPPIPAKKKAFSDDVVVSAADWNRMQDTYKAALEFLAISQKFEGMKEEVERLDGVLIEKSKEIEQKSEELNELDDLLSESIQERISVHSSMDKEKQAWIRTQERESVKTYGIGYKELRASLVSQKKDKEELSKEITAGRAKLEQLRQEIAGMVAEMQSLKLQAEELPHEMVLDRRVKFLEKRLGGFLKSAPEIQKRYDAFVKSLKEIERER